MREEFSFCLSIIKHYASLSCIFTNLINASGQKLKFVKILLSDTIGLSCFLSRAYSIIIAIRLD